MMSAPELKFRDELIATAVSSLHHFAFIFLSQFHRKKSLPQEKVFLLLMRVLEPSKSVWNLLDFPMRKSTVDLTEIFCLELRVCFFVLDTRR